MKRKLLAASLVGMALLGVLIAEASMPRQTADELMTQGLSLRDEGKLDDAAFAFRSAVRKNDKLGTAHFELGKIYLKQGKDALAKASLFRAVSLTPENTAIIQVISENSARLANIELEDAYAARDKQEAEDAKRGAANTNPGTSTPPPANQAGGPVQPIAPPADPKPVTLPALKPVKGQLVGRVVRPDGSPVPEFTIQVSGFEDGKLAQSTGSGGFYETFTKDFKGSGGKFAIKLPPGAYRASGYTTHSYKGRTYNFEIELINEPTYDYQSSMLEKVDEGLVRDFVLKMDQKKKDASEDTETVYRFAYFGGILDFDTYQSPRKILGGGHVPEKPLYDSYPPESLIELTLTPQGPMVDGTKGKVIKATYTLGQSGQWTFLKRGIYPGTYTATARMSTPTGETFPLKLSLKGEQTQLKGYEGQYDLVTTEFHPSVTLDFLPFELGPIPRMGLNHIDLYFGK